MLREREFERALADVNAAIRLDPSLAMAYNARGLINSKKGELDGALSDYNETLKLDPRNAAAYNNRGLVYRESA